MTDGIEIAGLAHGLAPRIAIIRDAIGNQGEAIMGLDFIELLFWWIGRFFWRNFMKALNKSAVLSDGAYEVVGFFLCVIVVVVIFVFLGIANV